MPISEETWLELRSQIQGELYWDQLYKGLYATDASNYQILPLACLIPKSTEDLIVVIRFAKEQNLSLLARGGGTSLVGQTVGRSIVIDFSKHMNNILEVNVKEEWALVEPGIVRDELNRILLPNKLQFAPDPATTSRATIGGMIANNSSGTRSILYGKTLDHVIELEVLLDDGSSLHCKSLNQEELEQKLQLSNKEGKIYRTLFDLVTTNRNEINIRFPKVMRRVGGYNLDEFLESNWNLSRIIVGSEGTLGIITKAKIKLVQNPNYQCICAVHFDQFYKSISHVEEMVRFGPASVELLGDLLIEKSRLNIETKRYCDFIVGDPNSIQLVEFFGSTLEDAVEKAEKMKQHLIANNIGYAHPIYTDAKRLESIFTIRKKGLGLLMGVKGTRKPIAFIEDAAVPLEHLAEYIREVFDVCKKHETPVVAYAHSSVGLLHVKPLLDLRDQDDIIRMKKISEEVLDLVIKYKGSWSGEHGDGLARGPFNLKFFGPTIYNAFLDLKTCFDPHNLFNPGKIINTPNQEENLRYGKNYSDQKLNSVFHFREEGGFHEAVHLCNGVAECRKLHGGIMCPTFRATQNEKDSTRGRANTLRLALSGQLDLDGLDSDYLHEVLDLCISCKACKSECPSNVDMSKLKSEILHFRKSKNGISLVDRMIINQSFISDLFTGYLSRIVNPILKSRIFRLFLERVSGLDSRRVLPLYSNKKFKNSNSIQSKEKKIVLFVDSYINYHEPWIGEKAIRLLNYLGFQVDVVQKSCCQRPAISKGLLKHAKLNGLKTMQTLEPYLIQGIPVLVCEPSCATSLKDDLVDLLDDVKWIDLSKNIWLIEDFIVEQQRQGKITKEIPFFNTNYKLHGHCHQKSIFTTQGVHQLFSKKHNIGFTEIETTCCGMAGSFGYEKVHYELSEKMARMKLIPELENISNTDFIIAQGFSCRHQIKDFSDKRAIHWLEAIDL
ncbi:MAG: FAD-binding oxidoreductase [Saprospiraceae bacterium]|nr:FAD-binding oxidoreductase [Saprospiraceae bacterium]